MASLTRSVVVVIMTSWNSEGDTPFTNLNNILSINIILCSKNIIFVNNKFIKYIFNINISKYTNCILLYISPFAMIKESVEENENEWEAIC